MSLIPVREALRMLEAERLVSIEPNKGARVAPLSIDRMKSAYAVRLLLEPEAVRLSTPNLDGRTLATARLVKDQMVDAMRRDDPSEAARLHRRLHFLFYEACESEWLLEIITMLFDQTERYRRLSAPLRSDVDEVDLEHARVLDAIGAGDPQAAARSLELHLGRTTDLMSSAYQVGNSDPDASASSRTEHSDRIPEAPQAFSDVTLGSG